MYSCGCVSICVRSPENKNDDCDDNTDLNSWRIPDWVGSGLGGMPLGTSDLAACDPLRCSRIQSRDFRRRKQEKMTPAWKAKVSVWAI